MRRFYSILASILLVVVIMLTTNFVVLAEGGLTDQENAAFITRDEFIIWKNSFIASLSELDYQSTQRIYKDMDFYDMQYRFTDMYKQEQYWDKDLDKPKPILEQMIIDEKIRRGIY